MTVEMFVCLGYGRFSYTGGDFRVGETPALPLGDGFSYTSYGPGDNVAGDRRSEVWFNSTEVGGTSSGSSQRGLVQQYRSWRDIKRVRSGYGSDCP